MGWGMCCDWHSWNQSANQSIMDQQTGTEAFPSPRISLTSPNVDEKKCCVIGIRGASWNPIQDWGQLLYRCWTASSNLQRVIIYTYTQHQLFKRMTINHEFCEAVASWLSQVQSSRYPVLSFLKLHKKQNQRPWTVLVGKPAYQLGDWRRAGGGFCEGGGTVALLWLSPPPANPHSMSQSCSYS